MHKIIMKYKHTNHYEPSLYYVTALEHHFVKRNLHIIFPRLYGIYDHYDNFKWAG
jgi:hypothetical protein